MGGTGIHCWSRRPRAAAGAACGWSSAPQDLDAALESARREARVGFGDDRVFIERFLPRARHLEVQVIADAHGSVLHLGERECSLQRARPEVETWSNTGTISSTNSTVFLSGVFTQAGLGNFSRDAASTVNLDGTLNGGLTLNDTLGAWNLTASGILNGGTTLSPPAASPRPPIAIAAGGTLTNVTLNNAIDLTTNSSGHVSVNGDLTVNTTLAVGDPTTASKSGSIWFNAGTHISTAQALSSSAPAPATKLTSNTTATC